MKQYKIIRIAGICYDDEKMEAIPSEILASENFPNNAEFTQYIVGHGKKMCARYSPYSYTVYAPYYTKKEYSLHLIKKGRYYIAKKEDGLIVALLDHETYLKHCHTIVTY